LAVLAACSDNAGGPRPFAAPADTGNDAAAARERPAGPAPRVSPLSGASGEAATASTVDLAARGYVEEEFLLSGEASSYAEEGEWGRDGRWVATPAGTAAYTTRALVRRPSAADEFNGTVIVEWFNVTAGVDASPSFGYLADEMLRRGYIWVGVSAQEAGAVATAEGNPARYGDLEHPGDAFAYDIFTQVGRAARAGALFDKTYEVDALLAAGESQSAILLTTYVNAIDPLVKVYDGFYVHSRFSMAAGLGEGAGPNPAYIRDDLEVPVLVLLSETDIGFNLDTRQPDGERFRLWEIAGTAHADQFLINQYSPPTPGEPPPNPLGCSQALNSANQHWVLKAGLFHLNGWVRGGPPPPKSPRVTMNAANPKQIERDEHDNALGGIRLPELEVPIATLSGAPSPGSPGFCILFGSTVPFEPTRLAELYPDHETYVSAYDAAVDRMLDAGFILEVDAAAAKVAAAASDIGR
jgi:hypothetical protein